MPDLSTPEGQASIDELITPETALIVVDNLSCLCRTGRENEAESWIPVQGWALRHRAAGRSILFIHHSGKNGEQRGASKKEDVLDVVLKLKRPIDYEPSQGACFEVIFEKARHLTGEDTTSFEATLTTGNDGNQAWVFKDVSQTTYERVIDLANNGLSQSDIAAELEINKSTVSRHMRKAKADGKLMEPAKK
jgi:DNA-binding CsgD family transcriptional regulator